MKPITAPLEKLLCFVKVNDEKEFKPLDVDYAPDRTFYEHGGHGVITVDNETRAVVFKTCVPFTKQSNKIVVAVTSLRGVLRAPDWRLTDDLILDIAEFRVTRPRPGYLCYRNVFSEKTGARIHLSGRFEKELKGVAHPEIASICYVPEPLFTDRVYAARKRAENAIADQPQTDKKHQEEEDAAVDEEALLKRKLQLKIKISQKREMVAQARDAVRDCLDEIALQEGGLEAWNECLSAQRPATVKMDTAPDSKQEESPTKADKAREIIRRCLDDISRHEANMQMWNEDIDQMRQFLATIKQQQQDGSASV